MEKEGNTALIFELADSVLRSWWTIVAGVCIGLSGATIALSYMPKLYEGRTKLLIIPQQIPGDFVRSTVTEDMTRRVSALGEYVFDISNMRGLASKYFGVPATDEKAESTIRSIRSRISVDLNARSGTLALTYIDPDPTRAAELTNDLAELYIAQSSRFRVSQVEETKDSVEARVEDYKMQLDLKQEELNRFLQQHYDETAGAYPANNAALETRQNDLSQNQERRSQIEDELPLLRAQLQRAKDDPTGAIPDMSSVPALDPFTQQLRTLQSQLDSLLINYQDAHPKVQKKRREIEELMARMPDTVVVDQQGEVSRTSETLSPLAAQIRSMEKQLRELEADESSIRNDISAIRRRIAATPRVQTQVEQLTSERDLLREKYLEFQSKLETAEDAQTLEQSENAQQIQVVEAARVPTKPIQPQPVRIYMIGLAIGLVLFVAPLPVVRLLNPLISSEAGVKGAVDVPLLVSIPRILTKETSGIGVRRLVMNLSLSVVSTALLVAVYFYMQQIGG